MSIKLEMRKLQAIRDEAEELAQAIVDKTAFDIEEAAKSYAAVDTGAMKSSIYTETPRSSGRLAAWSEARRLNPDVELQHLPKPKKLTDYVGPSVHYAVHVHFGTVITRQSNPFLILAVEDVSHGWARAWKAFLRKYE